VIIAIMANFVAQNMGGQDINGLRREHGMSELNREQIIRNLERLVDKYGENGSYNTYCTLSDTLALIRELTEENERFRYEQGKLIEERDTFREYAYNMQKYVENIRHKEEEGYEPSAARYAAEMEMWHVVALEKKGLAEENERLQDLIKETQQYNEAWVEDNGKLRQEMKKLKADTVHKVQDRLRNIDEFYKYSDVRGELYYLDLQAWVQEIEAGILEEDK
jgi:hypothetical protein